ncbi:MAG: sigma factor-like helix-turn-helix DNA-binding protein [Thermomicrobiales bacterium]
MRSTAGFQAPPFGETFREGKISAVERLTAAYGGRVYGVARAILQDDLAAQDAAADALRLVLEQREAAPDQLTGVGRWWIAVTRRAAIDRRRGRLSDSESTAQLVPRFRSGQRELQAALAELESDQREALTLVVQDGATVAEAARRLNQPIPAVVISLRDALTSLHDALSPAGADAPVDSES